MKKKIIFTLLAAILSFAVLAGCGPQEDGLSKGFGLVREYRPVAAAVSGDKTEFDVSGVTVTFHYGWLDPELGSSDLLAENEWNEFICFAAYFGWRGDYFNTYTPHEDYRAIDGLTLVREMSKEEFFSDAYAITRKRFENYTFAHSKTVKIPESAFKGEIPEEVFGKEYGLFGGSLTFGVTAVYKYTNDDRTQADRDGYYFRILNGYTGRYSPVPNTATVSYEFITPQTVRLS